MTLTSGPFWLDRRHLTKGTFVPTVRMVQVLFFTTAGGRQPALDYIKTLRGRDAVEVEATILALGTHGLSAPRVDLKHVEGKLWEFRTSAQRVFYVVIQEEALVILHAYKKQGQKAPLHELEVARGRAKLVLGR